MLIVADVLVRFMPSDYRPDIAPAVNEMAASIGPDSIFSELDFIRYRSKLGDHVLANGGAAPSAQRVQIEPDGDDRWSSGVSKYRLLAIFKGLDRFAVLKKVDLVSGDVSVIRVREGEFIDGFLLESISLLGVTLSDQLSERVALRLFAANGDGGGELDVGSSQIEKSMSQ